MAYKDTGELSPLPLRQRPRTRLNTLAPTSTGTQPLQEPATDRPIMHRTFSDTQPFPTDLSATRRETVPLSAPVTGPLNPPEDSEQPIREKIATLTDLMRATGQTFTAEAPTSVDGQPVGLPNLALLNSDKIKPFTSLPAVLSRLSEHLSLKDWHGESGSSMMVSTPFDNGTRRYMVHVNVIPGIISVARTDIQTLGTDGEWKASEGLHAIRMSREDRTSIITYNAGAEIDRTDLNWQKNVVKPSAPPQQ